MTGVFSREAGINNDELPAAAPVLPPFTQQPAADFIPQITAGVGTYPDECSLRHENRQIRITPISFPGRPPAAGAVGWDIRSPGLNTAFWG